MPDPWPRSARWTSTGLEVGGLPAADLAERFGTPVLVFDEDDLRARMRTLADAFPRVAYAVKAMTCGAVIRAAIEEGLGLLCASSGEVRTCLRAGAPASRVLLHGNAKTDGELQLAVDARLGVVIVDDEEELDRLAALARAAGVSQPILLRVTPDVAVATHEAIATGHADSKFGVPLGAAPSVARRGAATAGVRLLGLHAHAGSQVFDADAHVRVVRALLTVAAEAGVEPAVLDVGGGFGVAYTDEPPTDPAAIAAALRGELDARGVDAAIQVEPGRAIVANPGVTLYRVLAKKRAGGRTLVAVDGGMSDNPRPALYDARYAVAAVRPGAGPRERVTVVGRHCESGDVVAHDVELPADLSRGDLLVVAATGAYTYPLASAYNRFGRPAVVGVRGGTATEWIRRETSEDMDRLDVILGSRWDAGSVPMAEGGART